MKKSEIGIIGLAVMGGKLARNLEAKGYPVSVFNRSEEKRAKFQQEIDSSMQIYSASSLTDFTDSLESPKKILLLIKAGTPVDETIAALKPSLHPGDILMDGGNSYYMDTVRREKELRGDGIHFIGIGFSGGGREALNGPSIMAGGDPEAWESVRPMLEAAAAKVNGTEPCCALVGPAGSGHFLKMLHNGIEYADMELIAEVYAVMRDLLHMRPDEMSHQFEEWDRGALNSYLVEAAGRILRRKDPKSEAALIDRIVDRAYQNGTGKWSIETALALNIPATMITDAVFARILSDRKSERMKGAKLLAGPLKPAIRDRPRFLNYLRRALYAAKICAYAQGFQVIHAASGANGWNLDYARISRIWRDGCTIRARFLDQIAEAYNEDPALENLILAPCFRSALANAQDAWREVLCRAIQCGLAMPAMAAGLEYYDSCRSEVMPANMVQALRDCFGSYSFERTDCPPGEFYHDEWDDTDPEQTNN